eukprot:Clim_evm6s64 gene=Clim_evmTU6s64
MQGLILLWSCLFGVTQASFLLLCPTPEDAGATVECPEWLTGAYVQEDTAEWSMELTCNGGVFRDTIFSVEEPIRTFFRYRCVDVGKEIDPYTAYLVLEDNDPFNDPSAFANRYAPARVEYNPGNGKTQLLLPASDFFCGDFSAMESASTNRRVFLDNDSFPIDIGSTDGNSTTVDMHALYCNASLASGMGNVTEIVLGNENDLDDFLLNIGDVPLYVPPDHTLRVVGQRDIVTEALVTSISCEVAADLSGGSGSVAPAFLLSGGAGLEIEDVHISNCASLVTGRFDEDTGLGASVTFESSSLHELSQSAFTLADSSVLTFGTVDFSAPAGLLVLGQSTTLTITDSSITGQGNEIAVPPFITVGGSGNDIRIEGTTASEMYATKGGLLLIDNGISTQDNNVTIASCHFQKNFSTEGGAVVFIGAGGNSLTIVDSEFYDNDIVSEDTGGTPVQVQGAVVHVRGSQLVVSGRTLFQSNNAGFNGSGGTIYLAQGTSNVAFNATFQGGNVEFGENFAGNGGALWLEGRGTLAMTGLFTNNTALESGGAIYAQDLVLPNALTTADVTTFVVNSASTGNGGAIFISGGPLATVGDEGDFVAGVHNATSATAFLQTAIFRNNTASVDGGALAMVAGSDALLRNCIIDGNTALQRGGGVFMGGGDTSAIPPRTLLSMDEGTTLRRNKADNGGGFACGGRCHINVGDDVRLFTNVADEYGGGFAVFPSDNAPARATQANSVSLWWYGARGLIRENQAEDGGGFLAQLTTSTTLDARFQISVSDGDDGLIVRENTALNGGACYLAGKGSTQFQGSVEFDSNTAAESGGACLIKGTHLFTLNTTSTLFSDPSSVQQRNVALNNGGFINAEEKALVRIINTAFISGYAGYSGALFATSGQATLTLTGVWSFDANGSIENAVFAARSAGLVFAGALSSVTIENCDFTSVPFQSDEDGGAILANGYPSVAIRDSQIGNSRSRAKGGVIAAMDGAILNLDNVVLGPAKAMDSGGCIAMWRFATLFCRQCVLENCYAGEDGGGLWASLLENLQVQNSLAETNTTTVSRRYTTAELLDIFPEIEEFEDEYSSVIEGQQGRGPAVFLTDSFILRNNSAQGSGGGLFAGNAVVLDVADGLISNNEAMNGNGGGMYVTSHAVHYIEVSRESSFVTRLVRLFLSSNKASNGFGGGVVFAGDENIGIGDISLRRRQADDGDVQRLFLDDVNVSGNFASAGGAVWVNGTTLPTVTETLEDSAETGSLDVTNTNTATFYGENLGGTPVSLRFDPAELNLREDNLVITESFDTANSDTGEVSQAVIRTAEVLPSFTVEAFDTFGQAVRTPLGSMRLNLSCNGLPPVTLATSREDDKATFLFESVRLPADLVDLVTGANSETPVNELQCSILMVYAVEGEPVLEQTYGNSLFVVLDCNSSIGRALYTNDISAEEVCVGDCDRNEALRISYQFFVALFLLGLLVAAGMFGQYRNHPAIKGADPVFLVSYVLTGLAILLTAIAALTVSPPDAASCTTTLWCFHLGFALAVTGLLARNQRIHAIFHNRRLKEELFWTTDRMHQLVLAVAGWTLLWLVVHTFGLEGADENSQVVTQLFFEGQAQSEQLCEKCVIMPMSWAAWMIYLSEGLLLVYAVILSVGNRKVPSDFNEAKLMAACIWTITLCLLAAVPLLIFAQNEQPEVQLGVAGAALFIIVGTVLSLVAIPRLSAVHRGETFGQLGTTVVMPSGLSLALPAGDCCKEWEGKYQRAVDRIRELQREQAALETERRVKARAVNALPSELDSDIKDHEDSTMRQHVGSVSAPSTASPDSDEESDQDIVFTRMLLSGALKTQNEDDDVTDDEDLDVHHPSAGGIKQDASLTNDHECSTERATGKSDHHAL